MGLPSYRVRKAVAGSVPCSATRIQTPTGCGWDFYVLPPAPVRISRNVTGDFAKA